MKLDEVIKYQEKLYEGLSERLVETYGVALKVGIEASKAYQKAKAAGWYPPGYKLPGETEE